MGSLWVYYIFDDIEQIIAINYFVLLNYGNAQKTRPMRVYYAADYIRCVIART